MILVVVCAPTNDLMKRSGEHEGSYGGRDLGKCLSVCVCVCVTFLRTRKSDHKMYQKVGQIDGARKIRVF